MTYSTTGYCENSKFDKEFLSHFQQRGKNRLADILIVKDIQTSERRINQYIENDKIVLKYTEAEAYLRKNYPEYFL